MNSVGEVELRERSSFTIKDHYQLEIKKDVVVSERTVTFKDTNIWERYSQVEELYKYLPQNALDEDLEKLFPTKLKHISQTAPAELRALMEDINSGKKPSHSKSSRTTPKSRSNQISIDFDDDKQAQPHHHSRSLIHSPLRKNIINQEQSTTTDDINTRSRTSSDPAARAVETHPLLVNIKPAVITKAVSLFKEKPSQGVKYLISEGAIPDDPATIGTFLFVCDKFDKVQLGEYLSRGVATANSDADDPAAIILNSYVSNLKFDHMDFDLALRFFLYRFRLPGEAQKIDRLMKMFAAKYFEVHKDDNIMKNELYVYAISFGTIMLNTDLYNEHVKYKMTLKQFIDNIQYFNTNGPPATDIPVEFLEDLYFKIEIDEIKMEKERSLFPNALKRGWIFVYAKTGMGSNRWKRRWIILSDNCLFIFRKYDDERLVYKIALNSASISVVGKEKGRQFCLWLHLPPQNITSKMNMSFPRALDIDNQKIHILFSANNSVEISLWSRAVEFCIVNSTNAANANANANANNNNNNSNNNNTNNSVQNRISSK